MSCEPGSAKKTIGEGNSGYPHPIRTQCAKPNFNGQMTPTETADSKGYLLYLRARDYIEPERLPDGDWRVTVESPCGRAFVIIHHDSEIDRHLAILFDENGNRVARMTADGDTHIQALENLRQIAVYEESAIWNMGQEQQRKKTQKKREETRRKKIIAAAEAVRSRNGPNGRELIDRIIAHGCTELEWVKLTSGETVVQKIWYLRDPNNHSISHRLDNKALVEYANLVLAERNKSVQPGHSEPETLVMYPEAMDHDAVERALLIGRDVPEKLIARYPDLLVRFGMGIR